MRTRGPRQRRHGSPYNEGEATCVCQRRNYRKTALRIGGVDFFELEQPLPPPLSVPAPAEPGHWAEPRPVRLVLEYDGSAFIGYQSQVYPGCRTVQDVLEVWRGSFFRLWLQLTTVAGSVFPPTVFSACQLFLERLELPTCRSRLCRRDERRVCLALCSRVAQEAIARLPGGSNEWRTIGASRTDRGVHAR